MFWGYAVLIWGQGVESSSMIEIKVAILKTSKCVMLMIALILRFLYPCHCANRDALQASFHLLLWFDTIHEEWSNSIGVIAIWHQYNSYIERKFLSFP